MNETRIYGTMAVLAGKDGCAKDLVNVFIPTFDEKMVEKMVEGNGQILATFGFHVDKDMCDETEWNNYLDRMVEVNNRNSEKYITGGTYIFK